MDMDSLPTLHHQHSYSWSSQLRVLGSSRSRSQNSLKVKVQQSSWRQTLIMAVNLSISPEQAALLIPLLQQISDSRPTSVVWSRSGDSEMASTPVRKSIQSVWSTPGYGSEHQWVVLLVLAIVLVVAAVNFLRMTSCQRKERTVNLLLHKVICWQVVVM